MRKLLFFVLTAAILLGGAVSEATASSQKQWTILQNAISITGNKLGDIDIYGYYAGSDDTVFIECDTSTQKPTGRVFRMKSREEKWTDETVIDYGEGVMEDWSKIRKIEPIIVNILAPNIVVKEGTEWIEGDNKKIAYGPVRWRNSDGAYLIPGSDPNYWLIVAEVHNPNSWSVRASISVDIDGWRSSLPGKGEKLTFKKDNVLVNANETKYILINSGKKDSLIGSAVSWSNPVSQSAWSLADCRSIVTENLDPRYPATLRPNKGFAKLTSYGSGPPASEDLSSGITFLYRVWCYPNKKNPEWEFNGTVTLTSGGWQANPGASSKNPGLAKNQVEAYFKSKPYGKVPYTRNNRIIHDDLVFWDCRAEGTSADIYAGPEYSFSDLKGPVLVDYTDGEDYTLKARVINLDDDLYNVGWCKLVPILKYKPIFLEQFSFSGDDGIGKLEKQLVPGYQVYASYIQRPYFQISESLPSYSVDRISKGYKITLQRNIAIKGINNNSHPFYFKGAEICLPNELYGILELGSKLDAATSPSFSRPDSKPTSFQLGNITLNAGSNTIRTENITTTIEIYNDNISISDVERELNKVLQKYFNWAGEAAFTDGTLEVSGSDLLSFNAAMGKYGSDYNAIGVVTKRDSNWLQALSYFNDSSTGGLCLRASDDVWSELQRYKKLSCSVKQNKSKTDVVGAFWPIMEMGRAKYETSLRYGF